jgi:hypothetical protein
MVAQMVKKTSWFNTKFTRTRHWTLTEPDGSNPYLHFTFEDDKILEESGLNRIIFIHLTLDCGPVADIIKNRVSKMARDFLTSSVLWSWCTSSSKFCTQFTRGIGRLQLQEISCRPNGLPYSMLLPATLLLGRAADQAVSRWLPTVGAQVRARSGHVGFVVDKVATGAGFLRVLRLPLPIIIPPNSQSS